VTFEGLLFNQRLLNHQREGLVFKNGAIYLLIESCQQFINNKMLFIHLLTPWKS
jgi:hypothetical protein